MREIISANGRITCEERFAKETGDLFDSTVPTKIMAIGPCCWGRGNSIAEAVKKVRGQWSSGIAGKFNQNKLHLFAVTEDARVDEMGGLSARTIIILQEPEGKKNKENKRKYG